MKTKVFVYGSLRQGALHAWRMAQADFVGKATVKGTLVKIDWYPGLILEGETLIQGEVYEVGVETLRELNEFEGIGIQDDRNDEYKRVKTIVVLADGREWECSLYEWQLGVANYEVVANGDWLTVKV